MNPDTKPLMQRYFSGEATDADIENLDARLAESAELRKQFLFMVENDSALREIALQEVTSKTEAKPASKRRILLPVFISVAIVLGFLVLSFSTRPVAELISCEAAAWESDLPTAPGSELVPGYLKLRSGIATVRFRSGVELKLEAPAHLILETPMRAKLLAGAAIIDVPEPAIGFILETPGSYAVDHGTRFSVSVDTTSETSEYEVLAGEISVHHETGGDVVRLTDKQVASVNIAGITRQKSPSIEQGELPTQSSDIRLGTEGRELTLIRGTQLSDRVHPHFLMAKRGTVLPRYDRKSLFAIDLSKVTPEQITKGQLRLNLVPCGLGFAARLPEISTFSIYGISEPWITSQRNWNNTPNPEQGRLLGSFDIPRSQKNGSFSIENEVLLEFIHTHAGREVTFLLVRESDELVGNGLVHAFASSSHPTASGPSLTLW